MVASATSLVFDDLKKCFNKNEVLARVVHFWEARNINKGGLLMGFGLFLIDQKGTTIHAFIPANRIACYEEDLKAGVIYKIKKFLVIDNKTNYKVTSHKFLIQFTQQTVLAPTDHAGHDILRQNFRIRSYAEFNEAVNKNEDLYDALGKLVLINDENFNSGVTNKRIDIHMQLKDGPIVRVTLWGNVAANFQKKLMESVDKPMVILATTMNPKTFREVTKPETVTLSELHQFLQNDTPPTGTFCCFATIVDILPQYGWYFIACTRCKCKLRQADTSLVCNTCNHTNTVGLIKYRVELTVCDKENVATFVIFDKDTAKLAGRKAAEILKDAQTGRVRYSRRRKAVATEERRIKAMRDQPCPLPVPVKFFLLFKADTAEGAEMYKVIKETTNHRRVKFTDFECGLVGALKNCVVSAVV
ncbi:hypothetical protein DY000_02054364 [Brassica cretica]|uniref:Replication protein A 70 kDa DNA-binding subunit B/D first OB fold domain-containing protein n=1 Tax=Brassica cretica TaxID=69181 RepID=A0ABQ7ALB1_BRACR|nr:hypothetical protein DY000_02054364 [Brassica cretica]